MQHTDQIQALSEFLLEYATTLMGAGVHTNRAVRNISRIAAAYGYSADMTIFQRNITMSLICKDDETLRRTSVRKLKPLAFNLNLIQILRPTPNTAPLICGACYNTQPEDLLTMA